MTTLNEREKRQVQNFEHWLKEEGILEEEDNISWVMEGAAFARGKSLDGQKSVQFLTGQANHERNRDSLVDEASDF